MEPHQYLIPALRAFELGLGAAPMLTAFVTAEPVQQDQATFHFPVVMTNDWNDNGWKADMEGGDLADFNANPVVFLNHLTHLPPVGRAQAALSPAALSARVTYADTPAGRELAQLYASNTMRGISAGILPVRFKFLDQGIHVTAWKLKEISAVGLPAYPQALAASLLPWRPEPPLITNATVEDLRASFAELRRSL